MNSLSYAILSVLCRTPMSGYQLGTQLNLLWVANLSQIYPLLAKLEKKGYVEFELIEQVGKPNKKEYYITKDGKNILKEWLEESAVEPIIRDEFASKFYASWLSEPETAVRLLGERKEHYQEKYDYFINELNNMKKKSKSANSTKEFSRYALLKRRVQILQFEIDWCNELISIYEEGNKNDYNFN